MTTAVAHRGPDDAGYYHSLWAPAGSASDLSSSLARQADRAVPQVPGAALGHRRLSIIDLAGGHQPLANEDGTIWIAFNGEIYNYRELQGTLEKQGHRFRTSSDTETIVHLYEQHGVDCVRFLRGMFAFAIWDDKKKQLFLARDRLGKKPLVYRLERDRFLFASELKALLQVPGVARELNPIAVSEYLVYKYVPHPHSILQGFQKLPPAHTALYRDGALQIQRYWVPAFEPAAGNGTGNLSESQARGRLRETLTEAVRLRMRSDVPLGAFLSGGIDSTIIAGLMQQLSDRPVKTFSIGFPVKAFDEREYARMAADHLKTEHHEQVVEPSALEILPKLIWHYDEPFGDSSAIPTMYLCEMARKHVTVALSGDGGDELFAGYGRYRGALRAARLARLRRLLLKVLTASPWQKAAARMFESSKRPRVRGLIANLACPLERRYFELLKGFDDEWLARVMTDEFQGCVGYADPMEFIQAAFGLCPSRDFVTRTTCVDVLTYLPADILNKVDIASMAFALEVRCPLLDQEVVDLAAGMPMHWKIHHGRSKNILIETFADLLPPAIQQRAKMGFGVPLEQWFRGELAPLLKEVLLDRRSLDRGLFQPHMIEKLVEEHASTARDNSHLLWPLLVLELWQQTFLDIAVPSIAE